MTESDSALVFSVTGCENPMTPEPDGDESGRDGDINPPGDWGNLKPGVCTVGANPFIGELCIIGGMVTPIGLCTAGANPFIAGTVPPTGLCNGGTDPLIREFGEDQAISDSTPIFCENDTISKPKLIREYEYERQLNQLNEELSLEFLFMLSSQNLLLNANLLREKNYLLSIINLQGHLYESFFYDY